MSEEVRHESRAPGVSEPGNLREAFGHHGSCLRRDMVQLQSLIDDAVGNLLTHFTAISELARARVVALEQEAGAGGQESDASVAQEIVVHSRRAVVDLQCHDMVSQLLGNMKSRIDALEAAASLASGDTGASQQIRDVLAQVTVLEQRKPTAQPVMKTGDIDLF